MSYNDWLQAIRRGGVDPRVADQAWLRSQFGSGTPPSVVINAMVTDRFPRAPLSPMVFTPPQAPGSRPSPNPPPVGGYIPRRYPPSGIERWFTRIGIVLAILGAIFLGPIVWKVITCPHFSYRWMSTGNGYCTARVTNKSKKRITGLTVWHTSHEYTDREGFVEHKYYGDLDATSLDPGESTTATFHFTKPDDFTDVNGSYSSGDILILPEDN